MTSQSLVIGKTKLDLSEYALQGNAILGIRGSGKTYTATLIAEQLMKAGYPIIAFDPIGIWRFLRVPGQGAGYPVVVAGGRAGDLPLTPQSAAEIVRAAMTERISLIIDLYDVSLSKKDWRHIVAESIRLLLYENGDFGPMHIFLEEAAEFVPQIVGPEMGTVYSEIEKLARMGGNARLGYTLINQRAEQVNKAVLELCSTLILHRQRGRLSITAISKWLEALDVTESKSITKSMPNLSTGDCWILSTDQAQPSLAHVQTKDTFHPDRHDMTNLSSKSASRSASISVDEFVTRLQAALSAAKEQPKKAGPREPSSRLVDVATGVSELQKQISELQAALEASFTEEQVQKRIAEALDTLTYQKDEQINRLKSAMSAALEIMASEIPIQSVNGTPSIQDRGAVISFEPKSTTQSRIGTMQARLSRLAQQVNENPRLSKPGKRIFMILVDEYPDFPNGLSRVKLASIAKLKLSSGGFRGPIADLKARKYIIVNGSGDNALVSINPNLL